MSTPPVAVLLEDGRPVERTCMICRGSELAHFAKPWQNVCLVTFEANHATYDQAEGRANRNMWPAEAWEAFRRLHTHSAHWFHDEPVPTVREWMDRFTKERARVGLRDGRGGLYQEVHLV